MVGISLAAISGASNQSVPKQYLFTGWVEAAPGVPNRYFTEGDAFYSASGISVSLRPTGCAGSGSEAGIRDAGREMRRTAVSVGSMRLFAAPNPLSART